MSLLCWLRELVAAKIPYVAWTPGEILYREGSPFWWFPGPVPSVQEICGCNCAGLLNLAFRFVGLEPQGTTVEWFHVLDAKVPLSSCSGPFPPGSILLRPFASVEDQGHLGIVLEEGLMVHAWPEGGICMEVPNLDYFTHLVLPLSLDPTWVKACSHTYNSHATTPGCGSCSDQSIQRTR